MASAFYVALGENCLHVVALRTKIIFVFACICICLYLYVATVHEVPIVLHMVALRTMHYHIYNTMHVGAYM